MRDDIRYAIRQLLKNPGFALVAVATLALGIGAASAMFGLIQGVLLSPPPYADPGRLVLIDPERTDGQPYNDRPTMAQTQAWSQARTFEPPAMYRLDVRLPGRSRWQRVDRRDGRHAATTSRRSA